MSRLCEVMTRWEFRGPCLETGFGFEAGRVGRRPVAGTAGGNEARATVSQMMHNKETPRSSPPVYGWPIRVEVPRKTGPDETARGSF